MVPVAAALLIEGNHKHIGVLQVLEHLLTVCLLSDDITERGRALFQDRGAQQESLYSSRLLPQDFLAEVVQEVAMGSAQEWKEIMGIAVCLQSEAEQLQAHEPPFGASDHFLQCLWRKFDAHNLLKKLVTLTAQADGQVGDQLQLTAAGQQTLDTLTTALHDSLAELLDGWSPEQEAELAALLRRVATDLFSQESSKELVSACMTA